jgi:hypothetical protein
MTNKTIIAGLVALAFVTGTMMTGTMAYADHKPGHQSNAGGVPDLQTQIDENAASIDSFFDVFVDAGELDAEQQARIAADEDLQSQVDSFFDVFTEISVHDADIDTVQTEIVALQLRGDNQQSQIDSFFDITVGLQRQIDSFFDVFTEVSVHDADIDTVQTEIVALSLSSEQGDTDLQRQLDGHVTVLKAKDNSQDTEIARIDTEILSMDLRGQSCSIGDVVTGVDPLGTLVCAPDAGSTGNSWTVLTDVPAGFADDIDNVDDADNDPTNEINQQLGGTRDLTNDFSGSGDCLIGEVKLFAGNFPPSGFAAAQGQLLPVSSNDALFSILGTTFGGDGRTTFALPDLRAVEPNSFGGGQSDDVNYIICTAGIYPSRS